MPKNQASDLITDQEIAFALQVLSGTMTDRQAAEAAGLNPDTASYTKTKPRVVAFMHEHRAAVCERLVRQETEEVRRRNQSREQVLARLWKIADLDPETTRNSASAQIKALSLIIAIEGLIPDRGARSSDRKSASLPAVPRVDTTGTNPVRDQDEPGVPGPAPGEAAELNLDRTGSPAKATSSAPEALVSASAPGNQVPPSMEKKPDTWRLRL